LNTERAILKGHLSELEHQEKKIITAYEANIGAVKNALVAIKLTPIGRHDLDGALVNLKEASDLKKELTEVRTKITDIREELA
jgi:nitrate reductase NapAB chaperone NapD